MKIHFIVLYTLFNSYKALKAYLSLSVVKTEQQCSKVCLMGCFSFCLHITILATEHKTSVNCLTFLQDKLYYPCNRYSIFRVLLWFCLILWHSYSGDTNTYSSAPMSEMTLSFHLLILTVIAGNEQIVTTVKFK